MNSEFSEKLLHWDESMNFRAMPWKGERDPYKIWLSEIILQQTRVEQGRKYYEAFINHFPTVQALAAAPETLVFKLWEGLGYYSRCRNLIDTAKQITAEFGGCFPEKSSELLKFKGIGAYTAAAIASFAFDEPIAVVDGNVQRIISRYFAINTPIDNAAGKRLYQQLAQALIDPEHPARYNQAIMDFGATVCKPRQPTCTSCCQQEDCEAFRLGIVEQLPVKEKKIEKRERWFSYFLIETPSAIFLRCRQQKDIWNNLYEPVLWEADKAPDEQAMQHHLASILPGARYEILSLSKSRRQILSHQIIYGRFARVRLNSDDFDVPGYQRWSKNLLKNIAFPRLVNQFLEAEQLIWVP